MKSKELELDVDFIGGERPLTKKEELAIGAFIKADKVKREKAKTKSAKRKPSRIKSKRVVANVK